MSKYKLISEYYLKGNNRTQIATLCDCSRTTVWTVLKKVNAIGIGLDELNGMSEKELAYLLFPERAKAGDGYLIPDFKWEEFQMVKHRSSIRLCWRRYCKRAAKQNLAAYSWKCFITLYNAYRRPKIIVEDPNDKIRNKLKDFNFLLSRSRNGERPGNGTACQTGRKTEKTYPYAAGGRNNAGIIFRVQKRNRERKT